MPEGPSILILKNKLKPFVGKVVKKAGGYGPMPTTWIKGQKLNAIETHGKHLFFIFDKAIVQVHLGLFGSIVLNERKKTNRKFYMEFESGEINGYVVNAKKITQEEYKKFDSRIDILSPEFKSAYVIQLLEKVEEKEIDDVLMDQNFFSGVGNKIRNEALYLAGIHPKSIVGKIPDDKLKKLISSVRSYAKKFYTNLEKKGAHKAFSVYQQDYDPDGNEVTMQVLKKSKRKLFFSERKQQLFN